MGSELMPCPFCGSPAERYPDGADEGYSVMCTGSSRLFDGTSAHCPLSTFGYESQDAADAAWNRRALSALKQREGWVAVSERLPNAGVPVLAFYKNSLGKSRRIRAFYAPPKTIEDDNEYEAAEYDEVSDNYFLREGWYENNEHDEVNWFVDETVTHWMPLPAAPKSDERK